MSTGDVSTLPSFKKSRTADKISSTSTPYASTRLRRRFERRAISLDDLEFEE